MSEQNPDPFGYGGGMPPPVTGVGSAPIGVPDDYFAAGPSGIHRSTTAYDAGASHEDIPRHQPVAPRYFDGDQYLGRTKSPREVWEIQQVLAQIGLLTGTFQREIWDEATATAYAGVLAFANQNGYTEQVALTVMGQRASEGGVGRGSRYRVDENGNLVLVEDGVDPNQPPLVTRTTDPKVLDAVFMRAATELTGMGWDKTRRAEMVAAYNQMEEQRQRDMYEAQIREAGTPQAGAVVDIPSPEAFADVYIQEKAPEERAENDVLNYTTEALSLLASPAWGMQ